MSGPSQLRLHLLGGLDVEGIPGSALGSRKARTLVKVLALARGSAVSPDRVIDALWPEGELPARPAEQVGVLVSRLRSVLGADRLRRLDGGWALDLDWFDVAELEARVDEAAARMAAANPVAARAASRAALALARGSLLADEPDPIWAQAECAAAARTVARARLIGAEAALAAGDGGDAAALAEAALDHDPYDEAALRVLMRSYAATGRPASALAAYARVRGKLSEDLGVDPGRETEELHAAILLRDTAAMAPDLLPMASDPPAELVGRGLQLAALDRLLARARAGASVLAAVEGEAGIGKTVLVSHWSNRLPGETLVVTGRCDELGRDLPLQPILDGLAAHLRTVEPSDVEGILGDAKPILGPLLGRFSTGSAQPGPTTVVDPVAGRALLFAALLTTVERAAGDRASVVVVEDVHLAGETTIEWLRFAVRRSTRFLVVATRRPEGPSLGTEEIVRLGPLDLTSVVDLFGRHRAPELHARSGGHPLFLHELASATSAELPTSLRQAVSARVDGLGEAAPTLRAAAILGTEVDVDLLAGVLHLPVASLLEHLEAGLRSLIIEERSATLAFRHELVREALAEDTTAARRAFAHREAARVLHGRPGHDPMEVAWHARLGGDVATAVVALVDAAATAGSRFDLRLAEELLSEAISLQDSVEARVARARVRIARFDLDGAEADASCALELGGGPASLEVAGWAAYYKRDYELGLRRAEEAVERSEDPAVRASCHTLSGRILHASGHLPEADRRLSDAVAGAPSDVRGVAQVFLGGLRIHQGRIERGCELVDRALLDPSRLGHPFALHHGYLFRALGLGMQGRPVEALVAVEAGRALAIEAGEPGTRFVSVQDNLRSWVLRNLGLLEQADECTQRALALAGGQRSSMSEMYFAGRLDLIEGLLLAGDTDGVGKAIEGTADLMQWDGGMAWHHHQRFLTLSARHALAAEDPDRAISLASRVVADCGERRTSRYSLLARTTMARARLAAGRPIDHDELDGVLDELERSAGLEAWRVTAELAAVTGVDRWWRDAERRAGALVARAGQHHEALRRYMAETFASLGR
ncbi:MAG: AAA family ATPase [Acidimicrobiales bacterium]|nr:AAA family ATPase [Acidimicrobiales bacterium]